MMQRAIHQTATHRHSIPVLHIAMNKHNVEMGSTRDCVVFPFVNPCATTMNEGHHGY